MTSTTSRFADLARWQALLIVALTLVVMASGLAGRMHNKYLPGAEFGPGAQLRNAPPPGGGAAGSAATASVVTPSAAVPSEIGDFALYRAITQQIAAGAGYYRAAAAAQRAAGYPLRPFITVRPPTLAVVTAAVGMPVMRAVLVAAVLLAVLVWWQRLRTITDPATLQAVIGTLIIGSGLVAFISAAELVVSHEVWAATLLALSWALHRPGTALSCWLPSVLLATAAVLIRELALPFLLLMTAFAVWQRQWPQVGAWLAGIACFAVALALHAQAVAAVAVAADLASPGWANFSGWPFFVLAMHGATPLRMLPEWTSPLLVPLVMLGWVGWRQPTGLFGALLFAGYAVLFMALGRPDNWYWGLLIAPLFGLGLMGLPQAMADLAAAIRRPVVAGCVSGGGPATDRRWPTMPARPASVR
jgi:hypothetical protein